MSRRPSPPQGKPENTAQDPETYDIYADNDLVIATFERARRVAKRRNGRVPSLRYQGKPAKVVTGFGHSYLMDTPAATKEKATEGAAKDKPATAVGDIPETLAKDIRRLGLKPTDRTGRARPPRDFVTLGDSIKKVAKERGWQHGISVGVVMNQWEQLVGPQLAAHTKVEMVKEGTLFISTDSTAWATNLRLVQRKMLQTIAEHIGPDIITQIHIYPPKAPSWKKGRLHVSGRGPRDTYG